MTIREIAAQLGVAPSSVSVVLNNKPGIRDELREKIKKVLIENGYTIKNEVGVPKTILFVYYQSSNYIALRDDMTIAYMNAVQHTCQEKGFQFQYYTVNHNNIASFFSKENCKEIDGIILLGTEYGHSLNQAILSCSVPVVILDGYFPYDPIDTCNCDNSMYASLLFQYLKKKGHRKIGYIKSKIPLGTLKERGEKIFQYVQSGDFNLSPEHILEVRSSAAEVMEDVTEYLNYNIKNLPSIFICDNDYIAVATMQALQRYGLSVPDSISIVGCDNTELSKIINPGLTTFQNYFQEMARQATLRIIDRIENPNLPSTKINIEISFVERNSVADVHKMKNVQ